MVLVLGVSLGFFCYWLDTSAKNTTFHQGTLVTRKIDGAVGEVVNSDSRGVSVCFFKNIPPLSLIHPKIERYKFYELESVETEGVEKIRRAGLKGTGYDTVTDFCLGTNKK